MTTGPDGTFRIEGIGRERVATLQLEGPTIETKRVEVRTRPGETIRVPGWKGFGNANLVTIYGANFEHVAGPTRPIEGVVRDQDTGKPLAGVMVRGEQSLSDSTSAYVHSIQRCTRPVSPGRPAPGQGRGRRGCATVRFRGLWLPQGRPEGFLLTNSSLTCEPGSRSRKDAGLDPLRLDIGMKRGVWVTGRVIDKATGKPARGQVEYFVYNDNPHLKDYPMIRWPRIGPHFIFKDGTFRLVAFPGPGVLAARADEDRYIRGCGIESFKHVRHQTGLLDCQPRMVGPDDFHTLAEIDPAPGTASLSHDLLLETGRTLAVTVLGPDGKPLPGTLISGLKDFQYPGVLASDSR